MLARQQRRGNDDGDLQPVHGGDEGGAQRHFGFAEADVAADEPIHRTARRQVAEHRFDAGVLVLGLLVREARDELVVGAFRRGHRRRFLQHAQRRDLDQLGGDLAQPLLELGLARLPGDAAEPVELCVGFIGAVARQQLDVLDRQEQLVAAGIVQLEAVVRGLEHGNGLQPEEAADAVVGVHDEIADRQARRLGQHVDGAALLAARAHQPIAENVLLADDGDLRRLETLLEAEHADGGRVAGQRQRLGVGFHALHVLEAVVAEQRGQALARAGRPRRDDDAARLALQAADMPDDGVEHVDVALLALGGEGATAAAAP